MDNTQNGGGGVGFREMTPDDADAVAKVEEQCFAMPWSRESFWQEAAHEETCYLVAVARENEQEKIIGYVGCWVLQGEGDITNVAIAPAYRGQHIARKMLLELIKRVKERGVTAMTLEVRPSNAPAIKLYEGLGFRSVGRRPKYYTSPVEDAEIMWNTEI